jgi:S-DNA-T family DNA segregation ATPase FtsK/SpoIIIE
MIAATQRPTQKVMGQGAVRSQMDIRICFRVRERKDVDLVLGQGMLSAGWHAHTLNAPGKFLVSAPEHATPRRARGYLVTDQAVSDTAAQHASLRPELDEVSQQAMDERIDKRPELHDRQHAEDGERAEDAQDGPEVLLWAALCLAPDQGISVPDLVNETGMSRRWVYYRLRALADAGPAVQTEHGTWRAINPDGDTP